VPPPPLRLRGVFRPSCALSAWPLVAVRLVVVVRGRLWRGAEARCRGTFVVVLGGGLCGDGEALAAGGVLGTSDGVGSGPRRWSGRASCGLGVWAVPERLQSKAVWFSPIMSGSPCLSRPPLLACLRGDPMCRLPLWLADAPAPWSALRNTPSHARVTRSVPACSTSAVGRSSSAIPHSIPF